MKTGTFQVSIPILNRQNNSIIPQFEIKSVEYFDDSDLKISEETPENMVVKPNDFLKTKEVRLATIDGKTSAVEFDSISEGVSFGKPVEIKYGDMIRYKGSEPIIAFLSHDDMNKLYTEIADGTFTLPMNVKGIIATSKYYKQGGNMTDCLGHAISRLRGRKTFVLTTQSVMDEIKKSFLNKSENPYIKIHLEPDKMIVSEIKELPKADTSAVNIPKYELVNALLTPEDDNYTPETVGLKAFNLGRLKRLQEKGKFRVPQFFVVPAGVWNYAKKAPENTQIYGKITNDTSSLGEYHYYSKKADASDYPETELKGLRRLIVEDMTIPKETRIKLLEKFREIFGEDIEKLATEDQLASKDFGREQRCFIARSSFNGEDSAAIATQGLYDSFPGIRSDENLFRGIKEVWASKWSDLAYMSRRNHKIPHKQIQPNVIVQEVVPVDYTFTANTADPRRNNKDKIVMQLSQGVYSCFPNSPYIFEYDKKTGEITRTALATKKRTKPVEKIIMDDFANLKYDIADYSQDPLNMDKEHYDSVMRKVFDVTRFIEDKFDGVPQDIEGGIIFRKNPETGEIVPEIHIWQTRDVHLLKR